MINLFTWADFKLPKVIIRKLGKHRSWGYYLNNKIHIDERLKGKDLLEIYIHEFSHHLHPKMEEEEIRKISRQYADFLWNQGYRKIDG